MQIEMIDKLHLKVELDNNDMSLFSVSRSAFLEKNNQARIVLRSILKNAYEQTGFDIFSQRLLVEIFPTIDDGCILLFTRSPQNKSRKFKVTALNKTCIFATDNVNNLLDMAKVVPSDIDFGENSLFEYCGRFFLIFSQTFKLNKHASELLSEYRFKKCRIASEFLFEHATLVCKKDAISRLAGCKKK